MDMRFYQDGDGQTYRFLWQGFRESAERAAAREGRERMKERLASAAGVSESAVENHLRPRAKRGANFPCDIAIIRAYGRALEGDERAFLELTVPHMDAPAAEPADPREVLRLLGNRFERWPEADRGVGEAVFTGLWELLGLYAATDCYNRRPDTGGLEGAEEYFAARLGELHRAALSVGDRGARRFLKGVIDEAEAFVRSYELPGVPERWLRLNPRLGFFDPVFGLAESQTPETLEGLDAAGRLRVPLPTPWERRMRGLYFSATDGDEAAFFTRELQETLVRVFREPGCVGEGNVVE